MPSNVDVFNRDAARNAGYVYTTNASLSSRMATQRTLDLMLQHGSFAGRSILDVGCGDGFFMNYYWDAAHPRTLFGVDAAYQALEVADAHRAARPICFAAGDAYGLPFCDNSFDLVVLQSILHHLDDPLSTIREAFRLAPQILIHEPNGNNLGLKVIEKVSRYHREHGEKSYAYRKMVQWIEEAGGHIVTRGFGGFVPMFCPDWMARLTKAAEPAVQSVPLVNTLACAVYVIVAARNK